MKKVSTTRGTVKQASSPVSMAEEFMGVLGDPDTRVAAIQSLIPLGLAAVCEAPSGRSGSPLRRAVRPPGQELVQPALGQSAGIGVSGRSEDARAGAPRARHRGAKRSDAEDVSQVPATGRPGRDAVPSRTERSGLQALRRQRKARALCLRACPPRRCPAGSLRPRPGSWPRSRSGTCPTWTWWPCSWTARPLQTNRCSSAWA